MDRNVCKNLYILSVKSSLSARRAWIEIHFISEDVSYNIVALRKESVDRNIQVVRMAISAIGRSPQGERG